MPPEIDLTGKRYGFLVALSRAPSFVTSGGYPVTMWELRCDCGSLIRAQYSNLVKGSVLTCQRKVCKFRTLLWKHTLLGHPKNLDLAPQQVFKVYQKHARKKHIPFTIEYDHFKELILGNCYYCDAPPSNCYKVRFHDFRYSGVDKSTPSLGYIPTNVVSCCWTCNRMKGVLTHDEFIAKIAQLGRKWIKN